MDVRQAVEEYHSAKLRMSRLTRDRHKYLLAIFATWCEEQGLTMEMLTVRHIRRFIEDVSKRPGQKGATLQSSSVRCYAQTVKAFLAWITQEEDFEQIVSPQLVKRMELPKIDTTVIETFTDSQIEALFAATEKQPYAVRDKALLAVLLDTGARESEIVGLTLDCVWLDADDSYIKVLGKGRKERELPLGRTARLALRRYITRYRTSANKAEKHVFLGRTGKALGISGLYQVIHDLGERARIHDVRCSPHTLRHTMACMYLMSGNGDIYKLSRLMGHTSVKITERYLQAIKSKQVRQENHSVLDRLKSSQ